MFDIDGNPINDVQTFGRLMGTPEYKIIAQEDVLTPSGDMLWVSTVWLGIDHGWMSEVPIIFETMVFAQSMEEEFCQRYATKEEARAGHERVVGALKLGLYPADGPADRLADEAEQGYDVETIKPIEIVRDGKARHDQDP